MIAGSTGVGVNRARRGGGIRDICCGILNKQMHFEYQSSPILK